MHPLRRVHGWWARRQLRRRWGTTDKGQIAKAQQRIWRQQVKEASDKWARNVADVPLTEWRNAMREK